MFNNNKDFYPTSDILIEQMLENCFMNRHSNVLEPHAGKGNIVDYLERVKKIEKSRIDVCELDNNLQMILRSKKYRLVDSDFLNYFPDKYYRLIIMNPPFSNADQHLDHALNIRQGAEIISLYPTESINNPYSQLRKSVLYKIKQLSGTIENLGSCFIDSERSTRVEVSLIKIPYSPKDIKSEFDMSDFTFDSKNVNFNYDELNNQLAKTDLIDNLVDRHLAIRNSLKEYINALNKIKFYSNDYITIYESDFKECDSTSLDIYYQNLCNMLKKKSWNQLLYKTDFSNKLTSEMRKNFYNFIDSQESLSFNKHNIEKLFDTLFLNKSNIINDCIEKVFDSITNYSKDNVTEIETWKTNKSWKVNKKFIVPKVLEYSNTLEVLSNRVETITDIEKAMYFILGKEFVESKSITHLIKTNRYLTSTWYESELFLFKGFKKGTIHMQFKDEFLLSQFNTIASKSKNWIGTGN